MALSSPPPWLKAGAVLESGSTQYTVISIEGLVVVLRSHKDDSMARWGLDMIARHYKPVTIPPWMKVGTRLCLKGHPENQVVILAIMGGVVRVEDIDVTTGIPLAPRNIRDLTTDDTSQIFEPIPVPVPRWCAPGSRIVLKGQNLTYEIRDIDIYGGSFTVFLPSSPTRIERFNLRDFTIHWRPFSTLHEHSDLQEKVKPRRALAPAVIPNASIPTAPGWLRPGSLIRPHARHRRRSFWVMSVHPDRGMCRIQRVNSFEPLQMDPEWEELAYETAEKEWEPLNADGAPASEGKCPHCGSTGGRRKADEAQQPYRIRIYHCANGHSWSFIDGGNDDGKPAPPTRFERELDL